jgi:hypothetical protein
MHSPYVKALIGLLLTFALCSQTALATGNQFKFRYTGGTTETKVKPDDWHNTMTVTSDQILLELKDGQKITVDPQKVNRLTYGQNARRMVGTMIALSLINPLALFGLFHKKRSHFVGIEYSTAEGKNGAVLVQADKDQYRAMLTALSGVTGKQVETITDKDPKK